MEVFVLVSNSLPRVTLNNCTGEVGFIPPTFTHRKARVCSSGRTCIIEHIGSVAFVECVWLKCYCFVICFFCLSFCFINMVVFCAFINFCCYCWWRKSLCFYSRVYGFAMTNWPPLIYPTIQVYQTWLTDQHKFLARSVGYWRVFPCTVVTCEIKSFLNYFSFRRRPSQIILFKRAWNYFKIISHEHSSSRIFSNMFNAAVIILK